MIGYDNADMEASFSTLCRGTNPHRCAAACECFVQRCSPGCALCHVVDTQPKERQKVTQLLASAVEAYQANTFDHQGFAHAVVQILTMLCECIWFPDQKEPPE
jgi:hypothetical protein